jgi:hypothetical protein
MLMIVFGAGASYGSHPLGRRVEAPRPPLTNELLSEQYGGFAAKYPSSRPAIIGLRKALLEDPDTPIEEAISNLYQAATRNPERAKHLLALRFYLCDLVETVTNEWWTNLHGFTHYAELLDRVGTWRSVTGEPVVLVTFNYDGMLERSAEAQVGNWTLSSFASYVERSDWRLYKLHGSVGWSRVLKAQVIGGARPNNLIAQAESLDFESGELRPHPWASATKRGEIAVAAPGIAVPTTLKQVFQCPAEHVNKFATEITKVDRLLTIGWRAAEPHVLELLGRGIPPGYHLAICDRSDDDIQTILDNLDWVARRSPAPRAFTGGFTGLLEADHLERWLSLSAPGQPL